MIWRIPPFQFDMLHVHDEGLIFSGLEDILDPVSNSHRGQ